MRPAIASILEERKVWNAFKIHMVALHYILLSSLIGYKSGALL